MKLSLHTLFMVLLALSLLSACGQKEVSQSTPPVEQVQAVLVIKQVSLSGADKTTLDTLLKTAKAIDGGADPKAYMAAHTKALDFANTLYPDPHPELENIKGEIAFANFMLGNVEQAVKMIEDSLPVYEASGPKYEDKLTEVYNNIGVAYAMTGRLQDARDIAARVLKKWRVKYANNPSVALSRGIENLAMAERAIGNYEVAINLNIESAALAESLLGQEKEANDALAVALGNRVLYLKESGNMDDAVNTMRDLTARITQLMPEGHPRIANILQSGSILLVDTGRYKEAEDLVRRAVSIREKAMGRDSSMAAMVRQTLISILLRKGNYDEALALSDFNLDILTPAIGAMGRETLVSREMKAKSLFGLGKKQEGIESLAVLVDDMSKNLPAENVELLEIQEVLVNFLVREGQEKRAVPYLKVVQNIRSRSFGKNQRQYLATEALWALVDIRNGDSEGGRKKLNAIHPIVNTMLETDILRAGSKAGREANLQKTLGRIASATFETGDQDIAFAAMQRYALGSASLAVLRVDMRKASANPTFQATLRSRQDILEARTLALANFYRALADGDSEAAKQEDRKVLELGKKIEIQTVKILSSGFGGAFNQSIKTYSVPDVQKNLKDRSAVLITTETTYGVYMTLITKDQINAHKSTKTPDEIGRLVKDIRQSLNPVNMEFSSLADMVRKSHDLYGAIFPKDFEVALNNIDHIDVISKGRLATLPFSVLVSSPGLSSKPDWLAARFSFAYPAGLLHFMRPKNKKLRTANLFVGIGDPVTQKFQKLAIASGAGRTLALRSAGDVTVLENLPSLSFTRTEITSIASAIGAKKSIVLTGLNATEKALLNAPIETADILSFATHGMVANELEGVGEAALVMSLPEGANDNASNDGILTSSEIANMKLRANWVILSACNTGAGESLGDDAFSGLTSAFLYAGADSLLVSHWPVRDDAASYLTVNTVKNAQNGVSKAQALQKSMLDLMQDKDIPNAAHPAIWAPFVLVGN